MIQFSRLILFILFVCTGCINPKRNHPVAHSEVIKQEIKTVSKHIINSWLVSGITGIRFLKNSKWEIDDKIYLNSAQDKGYLLLLNQDLDPNAELDYIQTLYVAREGKTWTLYLATLPNLIVIREKENGKFLPNTMSHLSEAGRNEIDSQLKGMTTQFVDNYINREYTTDLKKNQRVFLSKTEL